MGLYADNFKRNVGGWGGALSAAGDAFATMGVSLANSNRDAGSALGEAFGLGTQSLGQGFERGAERYRAEEYRQHAENQAQQAEPGSRERQFWEAQGTGNPQYAASLTGLWGAQDSDMTARAKAAIAANGKPLTEVQRAKNRETLAARQQMIEAGDFTDLLGMQNENSTWSLSRRPLIGADPDFERYFAWADQSKLIGNRLEYDTWGQTGTTDEGRAVWGDASESAAATGAQPMEEAGGFWSGVGEMASDTGDFLSGLMSVPPAEDAPGPAVGMEAESVLDGLLSPPSMSVPPPQAAMMSTPPVQASMPPSPDPTSNSPRNLENRMRQLSPAALAGPQPQGLYGADWGVANRLLQGDPSLGGPQRSPLQGNLWGN